MGIETLALGARPLPAEGVLPSGANPTLLKAYEHVLSISALVQDDLGQAGQELDPWNYGLRLYEAGGWAARHMQERGSDRVANATQLLACAAHFGSVKEKIRRGKGVLPPGLYGALVRYACAYNGHIRAFGEDEPSTYVEHATDAMASVHTAVNGERSRGMFANAINGMRHELWGACILGFAGETRGASLDDDLRGVDRVLRVSRSEGIPIDITSTAASVMQKCGLNRPAAEGVRDGVLVVATGVRKAQLGDTFEVHTGDARKIYNKRMAGIIRRAKGDPAMRRVAWHES
jgi:hypothetical protein